MERGHYFPSKNPFDKALTKAGAGAGVSARRVEWVDKKKCSGGGRGYICAWCRVSSALYRQPAASLITFRRGAEVGAPR